ncbi:ABC transporter ATP-binding protein [Paenibacillus sp. MMS18-CY102]|uniref:ABC transporter ATP-binding protein n=1 Tax=Paenibacillus sp. MMS18-CY102 TaxID=2682849 RepID=UPI001365975B|nr:ABC transporter ATP-binding protein [Paenibacillus sp. MMS18-CY102]MWC30414.1 ATP-binding cassette domain-containing protein [Paenibacillus sp. MMS18-CY102]
MRSTRHGRGAGKRSELQAGDQYLAQVLKSSWLRLKADLNEQLRFESCEVVFTQDGLFVIGQQRTLYHMIAKPTIRGVGIREAVGGAALVFQTQEGEREAARFTLPYIEAFRQAMPAIQAWIEAEPEHEDTKRQRGAASAAHSQGQAQEGKHVCASCGKRTLPGRRKCMRCSSKFAMMRRIVAYCRPYRKPMMYSGALVLIAISIELVPAYLIKLIIDAVTSPDEGSRSAIVWLTVGLAVAHVLSSGIQVINNYLGVRIGGQLMGDIRRDMFGALMKLSMRFFDRRQVSQFIGRIQGDTEELKNFLTSGMIQIAMQIVLATGILGLLFILNWQITLMILIPLPIAAGIFFWLWPKLNSLWYSQWQAAITVQNVIGEALQGIRVIKAFAQEQTERERFDRANQNLISRMVSMSNLWMSVSPILSLVIALFGIVVWYAGGRAVLDGHMTVGTLTAYTTYIIMFLGPVQGFGSSLGTINRVLGSGERVFEIIDAPVDVADRPDAVAIDEVMGEIRLEDVQFGYEQDRQVLHGIDLTIRAGEMIGLVGPSGAGKSTLINLICRFYDPDQGRITLDGCDLRDMKQESLRSHIGVVLQETFLFDGSIAQNIAYGVAGATPEQIMEAARIANAHAFITRLPEGYDTQVGERGHRLSGGEKQRIAIARAVLRNPRLLILDEATASVDTETEREIQEALARLVQGRTTIAIAHRLSTLRGADRLVVLEQGRIAEVGPHDELYARRGTYYRLVEAQKQLTHAVPSEVG